MYPQSRKILRYSVQKNGTLSSQILGEPHQELKKWTPDPSMKVREGRT